MRARRYFPLLLLGLSACSCGERLVFFDNVEPFDGPSEEAPESLHVYASDARVTLRVRSSDPFFDIEQHGGVFFSGSVSQQDEATDEVADGVLTIPIATGSAGSGTVGVFDPNGQIVGEREITVVDADAIQIAVTAPERDGFQLPAVDVEDVRLFSGGTAAFRTTLLADGEEIFGTHAVVASPADERITTRRAVACALEGCGPQRSAVALTVPEAVDQASDVELTAGEASLTLTVVPTPLADITALESEDVVQDGETATRRSLPLHVLAGEEPVFGAPVAWSVDGTALEDTGDVLTFGPGTAGDSEATAALGAHELTIAIEGGASEPAVTSITAACGQTANGRASLLPLGMLALVLLFRRRRWRDRG